MIKHYIIDGNNLIGKLSKFESFRKGKSIDSRSRGAHIIDRYFTNKKVSVTLHFDGHKKEAIKTNNLRIDYSEDRTADERIKHEIMTVKNPKTICVVSSDNNIIEFARVNSCKVIKSEKYASDLMKKESKNSEEEAIRSIDNSEIKKLFGVD